MVLDGFTLTSLKKEELWFASQSRTLVRSEELPDLVSGVGMIVAVKDTLIAMSQHDNYQDRRLSGHGMIFKTCKHVPVAVIL